jgi:hypothetical protein
MLAAELDLATTGKVPKEVIDWEDPRVRRLNLPELAGNAAYWNSRMKMAQARELVGVPYPDLCCCQARCLK